MNTYRIVRVISFPSLKINDIIKKCINLSLPGFTEESHTNIKCVNLDYLGYEFYEIFHEILINDSGLAFGFTADKQLPDKLYFNSYKKGFLINGYYNRTECFMLLSQVGFVIKDFLKVINKSKEIGIKFEPYFLDFNKLEKLVTEYSGAWLRGVSSRVSSTGMFGADLINEPLFNQIIQDGATLSSVVVPFHGVQLQINNICGLSSHQKFTNGIPGEIEFLKIVKNEIIDRIVKEDKNEEEKNLETNDDMDQQIDLAI